jgi:hypothetical protein
MNGPLKNSLCLLTVGVLGTICSNCSTDKPPALAGGTGGQSGAGGVGGGAAKCLTSADDLIADFMTDNGLHPIDGRSGGFYVYGDPTPTAKFDPPKMGDSPYPIDTANGDSCSGPGSFHTKATGFSTWGAALGTNFVPTMGAIKGTYDASKYKGVSFWAKATAPLTRVQVSFPDVYTDGAANPTALDSKIDPCAYVSGALNNCSPYLVKLGDARFPGYVNVQIDTTWKKFDIMFADTKQDPDNPGFHPADADHLDAAHLTGMAIQVNAIYSPAMAANDFEIWVDDVYFIK